MDFELSEDQKSMVQVLRDILTSEFDGAYFRRLDDEGKWPHEVMERLGKAGFIGVMVPEEYGGGGGTTMDATLCLEEAARVMGGPAQAYFTTMCFGARALAEMGTPTQRERILPGLLRARASSGCR